MNSAKNTIKNYSKLVAPSLLEQGSKIAVLTQEKLFYNMNEDGFFSCCRKGSVCFVISGSKH
jgi:hypothetical protein